MFDRPALSEEASGTRRGQRGAVFTRSEIVEFILDLSAWTVDQPLLSYRLLEPSCGEGDFLVVILERLLREFSRSGADTRDAVVLLTPCIRAVEIHSDSIRSARNRLSRIFADYGIPSREADALLEQWIIQGDFLLVDLPGDFTHVVGNPPYIRQECIPDNVLALYRQRYHTMYDRADIYIPFIERSLQQLSQHGTLGFICSDRWMKNKYGEKLRVMISRDYHLKCYVDMVNTPAFHSEVSAYPAITVITKGKCGQGTRLAHRPEMSSGKLQTLAKELRGETHGAAGGTGCLQGVVNGAQPWILHSMDRLRVVRRLEQTLPSIEKSGCRIGIGVATGADKVYIGMMHELEVEADRLLPLVGTKDITNGVIEWKGKGVINPYNEHGGLVSLDEYPLLRKYFDTHRSQLKQRNCAVRQPRNWYRTIDSIYPHLLHKPKLLIPDIKGAANIVHDTGQYYPHHNLYYIISKEWEFNALRTLLRAGVANLFVATYSTRMRGGYLRF